MKKVLLVVFILLNLITISVYADTATDLVENYVNYYFSNSSGNSYSGISNSLVNVVPDAIFDTGIFETTSGLLTTDQVNTNTINYAIINENLNPNTNIYDYYTLLPYYISYDSASDRFTDIRYLLIFSDTNLALLSQNITPSSTQLNNNLSLKLYTLPLGVVNTPSEYYSFVINLRYYHKAMEGASANDYKITITGGNISNEVMSLSRLSQIYNATTKSKYLVANGMSSFSKNTYQNDFLDYYSNLIISNLSYVYTFDSTTYDMDYLNNINRLEVSVDKEGNIPSNTPIGGDVPVDVPSTDYYVVENLNSPLNGNSNSIINYNGYTYYEYYMFSVNFSDYFRDYISNNAELYYSVFLDGIDNAILYRRKVYNPYYSGAANFTFTESLARQISSNTMYLVLEYKNASGEYVGRATYRFNIQALPSQSLSIQDDYNSSQTPQDVVDGMTRTEINTENGTYNPEHGTYDPSFDPVSYDWTNYFTGIFGFFKIAFAWLPAEIINIVATGFFILMGVMIYKFFRG